MEKRKLGLSNLQVSKLGLGCMSLGTDEQKATKIIEAALDEGVNYFDTADLYEYGVNEKLVGKTLSSIRDQVVIATKVGNRWGEDKDGWEWDPSKTYIKKAVKDSLHRLNTDYIDLYQLHGGTIDDPIEETIEAFEELRSEGLIKYYGISSIRPNVIRKFVEDSSLVSVMMQYSLLDRRPEETLKLLNKNNISVVTRGSVAKGLLSDKMLEIMDTGKLLEEDYLEYNGADIKDLLQSIRSKLLVGSRTINEIALQFNLSNNAVASVVTGASSVEQIQDNARAVNASPLTDDEITFLKMITKATTYNQHQ
ncbi:aldo/keto reductase [Lederbergia lenta]|uniref:aldo/keto reductase n=1 Tax=Lederbergia lenta TaxID=1467 RepID=UPI0008258879|nr:aldo/keto reductase [Lederbergia lenta]MEC2325057.1 aldo/keto reductase [Lederbergia lenta]